VVTLGAAVADEYNTPLSTPEHPGELSPLDQLLGLKPRSAPRERWIDGGGPVTGTLKFVRDPFHHPDQRQGEPPDPSLNPFGSGQMDLLGTVGALTPLDGENGATVVARLTPTDPNQPSGPGITCNQFGMGWAIAYGFFPGVQYGCSPDRTDPQRLPLRWGKKQRDLAIAPAASKQLANTPRPVDLRRSGQDAEVVEACKLQSDEGIAVVLLNWTDEPIHDLEVTVPDVGRFTKVSSAQGVPVSVAHGTSSVTVTMALKDVDVLLFEPANKLN